MNNWISENNEIENPTRTGDFIGRVNIKILDTPVGWIWVGQTGVFNKNKQMIFAMPFCVIFNNVIIGGEYKSQEEAINFANNFLSDKIKQSLSFIIEAKEIVTEGSDEELERK